MGNYTSLPKVVLDSRLYRRVSHGVNGVSGVLILLTPLTPLTPCEAYSVQESDPERTSAMWYYESKSSFTYQTFPSASQDIAWESIDTRMSRRVLRSPFLRGSAAPRLCVRCSWESR